MRTQKPTSGTDLAQLATRLRAYNRWRRGCDKTQQPAPFAIGADIDHAVKIIEDLAKKGGDEC